MEKIKCEICGKEFSNTRAWSSHIHTKHKISSKEYYDLYLKINNEDICPCCGGQNRFLSLTEGYSKHCSTKCSNSDINVLNKKKDTYIEKYGGIGSASDIIRNKMKKTLLTNYGVDNPSKSNIIRNKVKQTNLERYGVKCNWASKNPDLNGATTRLEKYGVEYPFQSSEIQHKKDITVLERYGVSNVSQLPEVMSKICTTQKSAIAKDGTKLNSAWETKVWNYCLDNNISISPGPRIPYTYNNKQHVTFIDFTINDKLYEVKGNHLLEGCFDYEGVPINEKLKIYKENNITVISENVENFSYNNKYEGIKFIDINNLEVLNE